MSIGGVWNDFQVRQHFMEKAYADVFHRLMPVFSLERGGSSAEAESALEGFFTGNKGEFVALYPVNREDGPAIVGKDPIFFLCAPSFPQELAPAMRTQLQGHLNHMMVPYSAQSAGGQNMLLTMRGFGPDAMYGLTVGMAEPMPTVTFLDLYPLNLIRSILLLAAFSSLLWLIKPTRRAVGRALTALYEGQPIVSAADTDSDRTCPAVEPGAQFLQNTIDVADCLLVLDVDRKILLCSKAMMETFAMLDTPVGFVFSAVFGPDASRPQHSPGCVYSPSFYASVNRPDGPVSGEVRLEKNGRVERYYLIALSLKLNEEPFDVCILKRVKALSTL